VSMMSHQRRADGFAGTGEEVMDTTCPMRAMRPQSTVS
jgi:hypothetical protein